MGVVERFGNTVQWVAVNRPAAALRLLTTAYSLFGKQARYFSGKPLLPARKYLVDASAKHIVRPLHRPQAAAVVNNFLPCEMLHAMGIEPMFPEGLSCYLAGAASTRYFVQVAERGGVPESFCSYHKAMIGFAESGVLPRPRLVLNTSLACDANHLSFRRLAGFYGIPHFLVDVPSRCDDASIAYVADQLREMTRFIEEETGRRMDGDRLREAVARSGRTIQNYRRYLALRATRSIPDEMTSEMFAIFATHVLLGTRDAEEFTRRLADDTARLPERRGGKRILWMHTLPHWQHSLRAIFNLREDCEIVGCDMTFDMLSDMDAERPYESMARRLLECSLAGSAENRIARALEMARQLDADGVVYFCHWGCKQTLGASHLAKSTLDAQGFPTLILDGDGCDADNISEGQMATRVQAFLEQLEGRK